VGQAAVPSRPEPSRPKGIQSRKLDLRQGYLPIPIQAAHQNEMIAPIILDLLRKSGEFPDLKGKLAWRTVFYTRDQAENAIARYIDAFYNPVRRHSALDFLSPIQFEKRAAS